MSEIKRAIETLNDAETWKSIVYGEPSLAKMINRLTTVCLLARDILAAELEREKNPLTCDGCKHQWQLTTRPPCESCKRVNQIDRYEPERRPNV